MTQTILSNPRMKKLPTGKTYLLFDLYTIQDSSVFQVVRDCIARRNVGGKLVVSGPYHPSNTGPKTKVEFSQGFLNILTDAVERKWGEKVECKVAYTVY